jgi:hypothetical protein
VLAGRDNVAARRLYASLSEGGEGEEEVLFELPLERAVEGAIDSE